jgi:integrase
MLPGLAREVLEVATSLLDGRPAAPDTARKHRMLLVNAMDFAVELDLLESNPVKALKWTVPASGSREIDRRIVVNHRQARSLLEAVSLQQPSGPRLVALFALMYYSALRPEEAVNVCRDDVTLPRAATADGWGELELAGARPHAGRHWTDDGSLAPRLSRAERRHRGEIRLVPVPPPLAAILRTHIQTFPDGPEGKLFYGVRSDDLPSTTYMSAWRAARRAALSAKEQDSPLAGRPDDLRHACVSTWLNAGVPAPQVAEWAGHSVDVLLRIYARCVDGQDSVAKNRISAALDAALEGPASPSETAEPHSDAP